MSMSHLIHAASLPVDRAPASVSALTLAAAGDERLGTANNATHPQQAPHDCNDNDNDLGRLASDYRGSSITSIIPPMTENSGSPCDDQIRLESGDTEIDAMGVSSDYIQPECHEKSSTYFGPASTASFLGLVRQIIAQSGSLAAPATAPSFDPSLPLPLPVPDHRGSGPSRPRRIFPSLLQAQNFGAKYNATAFHIPPRREADALIGKYWSWVYSLYPMLHRPSFEQKYQQLWGPSFPTSSSASSSSLLDDILFQIALNVIFALGAHFQAELDPGERIAKGKSFFMLAQQLFTLDLLAHPKLETVQCLLLMTLYLQSTEKPDYCWNLCGMSTRMAQAIGLHLPLVDGVNLAGVKLDQVDLEVRRRVWGGCILMDR